VTYSDVFSLVTSLRRTFWQVSEAAQKFMLYYDI
jgi:hypothetical protein